MPKPTKSKSTIQMPSRSLCLPDGYQRFDYYKKGRNPNDVYLDCSLSGVKKLLGEVASDYGDNRVYLYTQHEVFLNEGIIKHTRSSPNWEGGLVTYATCKHLMRSYNRDADGGWVGTWISGLCPKKGLDNAVMFIGRVQYEFARNERLVEHLTTHHKEALTHKSAGVNPRGDCYYFLEGGNYYSHKSYLAPPNHTRSVEFYKKSPGSVSERKDGKIPKWWRDIEYVNAQGRRPPCFILSPCFIFSKPTLHTTYEPKRATLKLDPESFTKSLFTP